MKELLIIFCLAVILDIIVGDPENLTHPVVIMGRLISWLEERLYQRGSSPPSLMFRGGILVIGVIITVFLITAAIIKLSFYLHYWLGIIVSAWLFSTTLATKSLKKAAMAIYLPLVSGNLAIAQEMLGRVVSRETSNLSPAEISRGAVETVAENTVDGVIAPLFYGLIGGPGLAFIYKAINTMDSMLGYKNHRYLYFGRAAAKLDDWANYLPARITGICLILTTILLNLPVKKAIVSWQKYAQLHPSPNGGVPESIVAGALGIRLGGYNWYHGQKHFRAYLGEKEREIVPEDIITTVKMMYIVVFLFSGAVLLLTIGLLLLGGIK
jgi:adenosylcobinamide-phosphate synthase